MKDKKKIDKKEVERLKKRKIYKDENSVVNLKRIERVKNERGRDRAVLNINPTK